jgi:hypothetical protein
LACCSNSAEARRDEPDGDLQAHGDKAQLTRIRATAFGREFDLQPPPRFSIKTRDSLLTHALKLTFADFFLRNLRKTGGYTAHSHSIVPGGFEVTS